MSGSRAIFTRFSAPFEALSRALQEATFTRFATPFTALARALQEATFTRFETPFKTLSRALQERIDCIAQGVAEDIEREKGQPDRQRGNQHQVRKRPQ